LVGSEFHTFGGSGNGILKKNGSYKTPHIAAQAETIERLINKGYWATFAIGFDQAKQEIDNYMKLKKI